jgi:dynein heavy chain
MATLTDTVHFAGGRTVLYCPTLQGNSEEKDSKDRDRVMDKERLQIMESIVIHWTRQIKEVVNSHDTGGSGSSSKGKGLSGEGGSSGDGSGPLDEIEFWKGRALDLIGIQQQLEAPKVQRIIEVLQYAKGNYIGPFSQLTQQIAVRAAESNDNLKFLESIRTQCTALRQISPEKIVTILPDLLNRIRLIWSFSNYYNDNDHVCGILRKISNEIIRRFKSHILISEILDGDVEFSISRLKDAISCGIEWKVVYHKTVQCISRQKSRYGRSWEIDDASIFAQIDAFVQRCRDLIEICESQMQFVRKSAQTAIKGAAGPVPSFGGTKAQEIVEGINGIQSSFEMHMDRLRKLDYDVLDVKVVCQVFLVHWLRDNLLRCVFQ